MEFFLRYIQSTLLFVLLARTGSQGQQPITVSIYSNVRYKFTYQRLKPTKNAPQQYSTYIALVKRELRTKLCEVQINNGYYFSFRNHLLELRLL